MKSFLLIDDSKAQTKLYSSLLKERYGNVHISHASNGREALSKIRELDFTAVLADIEMPTMNGVEFCKTLIKSHPQLAKRTGVISGYLDACLVSKLENNGYPYLLKPFVKEDFYPFVDTILNSAIQRFIDKHGYGCKRTNVRFKKSLKCTFNPVWSNPESLKPVISKTIDHSDDGMSIWYKGENIPEDIHVSINCNYLNISNRKARVVWSISRGGTSKSGLQWT